MSTNSFDLRKGGPCVNDTSSGFLAACHQCNQGALPTWIMRQAGRYLPDYREVRAKVSFQELCRSPELIAEVVRSPVERFDLDAAILFSDILTMLEPMGANVTFPKGGPQISNPLRSTADVSALQGIDPVKDLGFVLAGIREIKKVLPQAPLIGFAGSPFTLSSYLIEGGGSKAFYRARQFLYEQQDAAEALFSLLVENLRSYLRAQIDTGVDAVLLFESWGGILPYDQFARWVVEPVTRIFETLADSGVPRMLFVNNIAPYLDLVREIPCEVVSVDHRIPLRRAMDALPDKTIQGNLDPSVLFAAVHTVQSAARAMLDSVTDYHRLIVSLGHGIQPGTPLESVFALVKTVHEYRSGS